MLPICEWDDSLTNLLCLELSTTNLHDLLMKSAKTKMSDKNFYSFQKSYSGCVHMALDEFSPDWTIWAGTSHIRNRSIEQFSYDLEMKKNLEIKKKQQTDGNRAIWLVYRTYKNARGFCLVKRTLGWKNFMPENFLEISRYFALTSYCNTIGQSNNAFFISGISLARKRRGHILIYSSIGW